MKKWRNVILVCAVMLMTITVAWANPNPGELLAVGVNESQVVQMAGLERVAVANPDIADVAVVSGNELLVIGKAPGRTMIHIWSAVGRQSYEVEVGSRNPAIAAELQQILNLPDVRVSKIGKTVVLEGKVNDRYQKDRAEKFAAAYGEKVVNLLELRQPIQVKLEAKIIEIRRDKVDNLGVSWYGGNGDTRGSFVFGQSVSNTGTGYRSTFGGLLNYSDVNGILNLLISTQDARILSQPNMITISGDKATILAGGQIPIPVSQDNNQITIQWKDYGVKLEIQPEVNSEGLISTKVMAENSDLDWTNKIAISSTLSVPAVTTTKGETTIALSSGQTMAIGGLIKNTRSTDIYKIPLLGDLPIIGQLFKSKDFTNKKTELLILITPTVVDPATYMPTASQSMKKMMQEDIAQEKPANSK